MFLSVNTPRFITRMCITHMHVVLTVVLKVARIYKRMRELKKVTKLCINSWILCLEVAKMRIERLSAGYLV